MSLVSSPCRYDRRSAPVSRMRPVARPIDQSARRARTAAYPLLLSCFNAISLYRPGGGRRAGRGRRRPRAQSAPAGAGAGRRGVRDLPQRHARSAANRSRWRAPARAGSSPRPGETGAPVDFAIARFEMKYAPDWQPLEMRLEARLKNAPVTVATSFAMTTAINEITQDGRTVSKEDQISADDRRPAQQRVRQLRGAGRAAVERRRRQPRSRSTSRRRRK